jgi:hypothetical protein
VLGVTWKSWATAFTEPCLAIIESTETDSTSTFLTEGCCISIATGVRHFSGTTPAFFQACTLEGFSSKASASALIDPKWSTAFEKRIETSNSNKPFVKQFLRNSGYISIDYYLSTIDWFF